VSLWQKSVSELDFSDIDQFCAGKPRENTRLDFKVDFPNNLEKTIAAFANTLGGLILLGVDSDPATNTPIWPPTKGMPSQVGLEERVYQKATAAIYPPVTTVAVSPVIEN
jgi:predicted HTH transcriptional regulator